MPKRKLNAFENILLNNEPALQKKREKSRNKTEGKKFFETLEKIGFVIGQKSDANELNVDQSLFIRDLMKNLSSEEDVSSFLDGLEKLFEDEVRFKWCLMPTVTSSSCKNARNACQDSLVHLLLGIDSLQERVTKILLEKLAELSFADTTDIFDPSEGKSLACMILSQFRWLSKFINGTYLTEQLLELVKATPTEVQRDIILLLPEVVPESNHIKVAKDLSEIILQDHDLNVAILDTLSNLIVDAETISEVRKQVLKTLSTVNIEDLPGVVRFVINNLPTDEIVETITDLRSNLDFAPTFDPLSSSTPIDANGQLSAEKGIGCLVINQIKLSLKFQKTLCEAWIKFFSQIEAPENFKSFDIVVLIVLHSLTIYQKKVEPLLKSKIKNGEITEDIISITFRCHHEVLKDYIATLLNISEMLLRSIEPVVSDFGHFLYLKCFVWFDTFTKQEIVGSLVTHIGNGTFIEINAALATLLALVKNYAPKMVTFSLFIKNLFEYMDDLTLSQIRHVYQMLSILSYQHGSEASALEDDMHMIIRKQLTNGNARYRKMGIIGALMAAITACQKPKTQNDSPELFEVQIGHRQQGAIALLNLIKASTLNSVEAIGLFYDEFCRKMSEDKLDQVLLDWIDSNLLTEFEEKYFVSVNENLLQKLPNGAHLKFTLDDDIDDPIALNLYIIMQQNLREKTQGKNIDSDMDDDSGGEKSNTSKSQTPKNPNSVLSTLLKFSRSTTASSSSGLQHQSNACALTLASTFRLIRFRKQSQEGSLEDIDGLLGCPIILPELKLQRFSSLPVLEKHFILEAFFHTINWFRENINTFTSVVSEEFKLNLILRVQLLIELQELLCKYIQDVPNYMPPVSNFDCDSSDYIPLKFNSQKSNQKKGKKGSKPQDPDLSRTTQVGVTQKSQATAKNNTIDDSEDDDGETIPSVLNVLQPYFRELDMNVFTLFELGVTFRKPCDVYSGEKEREAALYTKELKFLLGDLISKLSHSLSSSFRNRFKSSHQQVGFSNLHLHPNKEIVAFCIRLIPSFCCMLEKSSLYFRNISADSDGIVDSLITISEDSLLISSCMKLIFRALQIVLSWKGFESAENLLLFKQSIRAFSSQLESLPEHTALQELIAHSIKYLITFNDAITSLICAAAHIKLLDAVVSYSKDASVQQQVSNLAEDYLTRQWLDLDKKRIKSSETNPSIQILLEVSFKHSKSVLQSIKKLLSEAIPNLTNEDTDSALHTLNKSSLSLYYKIMLSNLVDVMKRFYAKKEIRNGDEEYEQWTLSIRLFQELVNLIKLFDAKSIIKVSLQYGRQFIDLFLKHGMPLMDKMFHTNLQDVVTLLKELQKSTRYMQHVCCHSKVLKDVALTRQVPFLKKSLESLVYRVKIMLAVNKCEEAFWLGNLKNRDLKGAEILSQTLENSDGENSKAGDSEPETVKNSPENSDADSGDDL